MQFFEWDFFLTALTGTLATLTGVKGYAELDELRHRFYQFGLGVVPSEPNAYASWQVAWRYFIGTITGKRALYDAGAYAFNPPPVCSVQWDRDAWVRYIDGGGGRWIPKTKGAPYPARKGYVPSEGVTG